MAGVYKIAGVLFGLWLIAVVAHFVVSAAVHILLGAAVLFLILAVVAGQRHRTV